MTEGEVEEALDRRGADEVRATLIDHAVNHGLTMAEAGRRVGRSTVSSIIQTFRRENRWVCRASSQAWQRSPFTPQQVDAICEMGIANNAIRLGEIQSAIIDNHELKHAVRPYNTQQLVTFIDTLYRDLLPDGEMALNDRENAPNLTNYVVIWDNVRFHRSNTIRQWFATHNRMLMPFLPPWSPFLNPIEEFFSAWRWKVYDRQPHTQMTLLAAMDAACEDITAEACRGWIRHSRRSVPRCIAREDIRCDVDENMWPNRQERQEV
ncbi:hypothetical protein SRHO_G00115920 [Serrasalmus rhombeus]